MALLFFANLFITKSPIIIAMQIYSNRALFVGNVPIDAKASCKAEKAIISHGHADHVGTNKTTEYLCTKATAEIIMNRFKPDAKFSSLEFGKKVALNGSSISLHNSGHILGSAQVFVEGSKRVSVTNDFKTQDSILQKGATPLKCDILVVECTFGQPCYTFPKREEVYQQIGNFVKEKSKQGFVVLAGYSLGKAQELTKVVNEYAGIAPLVHDSIASNNRVYEKCGTRLGNFIELNHNLEESTVLIMPPSLVNHNLLQVLEFSLHKKVFSAMATGWSFRNGFNATFPLSDHADFPQLLDYVKQSEPKLVVTMHGSEREFASYVQRRLGISARALGEKGQKTIAEYV